jgi:hypothetical protein
MAGWVVVLPSLIPEKCHATPTAVGLRQFRAAPVSIFGPEDLAANTDTGKPDTGKPDRMADLAKRTPG